MCEDAAMKDMFTAEHLSLVKTLQLNFTCLQKGKGNCKTNKAHWLLLFTRHHDYTSLFIGSAVENEQSGSSAFLANMERSVSLMPV